MLKKLSLVALVGFLLSACGATSPDVTTTNVKNKKQEIRKCMKENKDSKEDCVSEETTARTGLICKRETVTGTRLSKRVCKTAEQRRREREASRDMVDSMQRRGTPTSSQ